MNQNALKLKKNQELTANSEAGSIIVWIMIMVALFAALSYAVSQGSRSGTQSISDEQAGLAVTEILDYASAVKRVVQELQINGCSDTEISFENTVVSGYINPNAPTDNSCHVFHPTGGGLQYLPPNTEWLDITKSGDSAYGNYTITGAARVENINTSDPDLNLILPLVNSKICSKINEKINLSGYTNTYPQDTNGINIGTSQYFEGVYGGSSIHLADTVDSLNITPKNMACIHETIGCTGGDCYNFYQVLIAR